MSDSSDISRSSVSSAGPTGDSTDISGSTISSNRPNRTVSVTFNGLTIIKILIAILALLLAFWLGLYVGHHTDRNSAVNTTVGSNTSGFGNGNRRFGGGFGTVTAISSSSISIQNARTGTTSTYAITGSTKITNDGQSASVSSIATGDTVLVMASSSNSKDAATIEVNPSIGGFNPGGVNQPAGSAAGSGTTE